MQSDTEEILKLLEENKLKIYKTAKSILKSEEDVCDAIQETLLSAYNNFNNLKNKKYFGTWIIRITINKCYDIINKNKVYCQKVAKFGDYLVQKNQTIDDSLDKEVLRYAIDSIDEDLRLVTVMYYYDDISVKDISNILRN